MLLFLVAREGGSVRGASGSDSSALWDDAGDGVASSLGEALGLELGSGLGLALGLGLGLGLASSLG